MVTDSFVKEYMEYLERLIYIRSLNESSEIMLPFFDHRGDQLSIYAEKLGEDEYLLSDDGYILSDPDMAGLTLTEGRKALIKSICKRYGMELNDQNEIIQRCSGKLLVQSAHSLGQALLQIDSLYAMAQDRVQSFLNEDGNVS